MSAWAEIESLTNNDVSALATFAHEHGSRSMPTAVVPGSFAHSSDSMRLAPPLP